MLSSVNAGLLLGLFCGPDDGETCYSETSADFQRITLRYITEDVTT
jgi:hypothetical protein